jgi:hypothetical protein
MLEGLGVPQYVSIDYFKCPLNGHWLMALARVTSHPAESTFIYFTQSSVETMFSREKLEKINAKW